MVIDAELLKQALGLESRSDFRLDTLEECARPWMNVGQATVERASYSYGGTQHTIIAKHAVVPKSLKKGGKGKGR